VKIQIFTAYFTYQPQHFFYLSAQLTLALALLSYYKQQFISRWESSLSHVHTVKWCILESCKPWHIKTDPLHVEISLPCTAWSCVRRTHSGSRRPHTVHFSLAQDSSLTDALVYDSLNIPNTTRKRQFNNCFKRATEILLIWHFWVWFGAEICVSNAEFLNLFWQTTHCCSYN